ncbi:MAG: HEPN domain-containing protein [Anaerolineae bacterium]
MNRYRDWLAQALRDLDKARLDARCGYYEWACFTAQQAAEKAVKALLMYQGYDVWGHGITAILRELTSPAVSPELADKARVLDSYYIPTRYPNGFPVGKPADYYSESQAQEAVRAAEAILQFCQDHLPG